MRGVRQILAIAFVLVIMQVPVSAYANTHSVTQVITISATVAPARSIVVNEQGRMTKIYSNTSENVIPRVYLNEVPGKELPLTEDLLRQYQQVIAETDHLVGVEIPVEPPVAKTLSSKLQSLFTNTISFMIHANRFGY